MSSKPECNIYEDSLYFRITNEIVPVALRRAFSSRLPFFVKGGRAIDAYLEIPSESPDWDVSVPDATTQTLIFNLIGDEIISKTRLKRSQIRNEIVNLKSLKVLRMLVDISERCNSKEVVDIVLTNKGDKYLAESKDLGVIGGIPFKNKMLLYVDLEEVIVDREENLKETQRDFLSLKKTYSEKFSKAIASYKDDEKQMLEEFSKTPFQSNPEVTNALRKIININDILIEKYREDSEYKKHKNMIYETIEDDDDPSKFSKFEKRYDAYLGKIETILNNLSRGESVFDEEEKNLIKVEAKYMKTIERRDLLKETL